MKSYNSQRIDFEEIKKWILKRMKRIDWIYKWAKRTDWLILSMFWFLKINERAENSEKMIWKFCVNWQIFRALKACRNEMNEKHEKKFRKYVDGFEEIW
jgi:hypothetical protein